MTVALTLGLVTKYLVEESDLNSSGGGGGNIRTKLPGGTTTFYTNFSTGSDVTGDGSSLNPWKSVQHALVTILNEYDFNGSDASLVVIQMASNVTDTDGIHFSPHALVGAQGGAALKIKGGTNSKIITSNKSAIQFLYGCVIQLQDVEIGCTGAGNGLDVLQGALVHLMGGVKFGACAVGQINLEDGYVHCSGGYTISGSAMYHLVNNGGRFKTNGVPVGISANLTFTSFILQAAPCMTTFQNTTISLNGFTVTGKRYEVYSNSVLMSNGGGANYFPGNVAGVASLGGQYM